MTSIDFLKVRPHAGDRRHGFEELCCQLAALEPAAPGSAFFRKGPGGDAGVECYRKHADGSEAGWQAKFFDKFGKTQVDQLDDSLEHALKLHPKLARYVVCLPIDLSDARAGKGTTQLARWQTWAAKWAAQRPSGSPPLQIELWGASQLAERLTREGGGHAGRRLYWFDENVLTAAFFQASLASSLADLGRRYSPETAVSLPVRQDLLAFARAPLVSERAAKLADSLDEARHGLASSLERLAREAATPVPLDVMGLTDSLLALLDGVARAGPVDRLPWAQIAEEASVSERGSRQLFDFILDGSGTGTGRETEARRSARFSLFQFRNALDAVAEAAGGRAMQLTNASSALLHGEAGSGKSHLLADAAKYQIERGKPALLLLGNRFSQDDPWTWLQRRIGLAHVSRDAALGALDAAAEAAGCRALILVDAINERPGFERWQDMVGGFLEAGRAYPHIGIVVSCRSTYLPSFEEALAGVLRIGHVGFAETDGHAAAAYLEARGIVRLGAPYLSPEFNNPLFLRSCCDALERQGLRTIPRGLQGVTAVFDFYLEAVISAVVSRLGLASRAQIPETAIRRLTDAIVASGDNRIAYDEARSITEGVRPSNGKLDDDLLARFESEGLLTVEPPEDGTGDLVRFTFERMADHLAAKRLLDEHLSLENPAASFRPGTPLGEASSGEDAYSRAGVLEALAVQLPERIAAELPDLAELPGPYCPAWQAFASSLPWRRADAFTERTMELAREFDQVHCSDLALRTRLAVATEPGNPFNASDLDRRLRHSSLPRRDASWSVGIARLVEARAADCPARVLVEWSKEAADGPIDPERVELAAMALAWLFATSHREIRDKATKSLSALLAPRLTLAAALVGSFSTVDDPYVVERVLCAAYGAAMMAPRPDGLEELAAAALAVLEPSRCPAHLLARDYARGIVLLARARGVLPASANIRATDPPYESAWPLETVSDDQMDGFTETSAHGTFRDAIVGSTNDFGDFGRYVIQSRTRNFAAGPTGPSGAPPTALELLDGWLAEFQATASAPQAAALDVLVRAALAAWEGGEVEREASIAAGKAFEATLATYELHDYWNRGRPVLLGFERPGSRQEREMVPFSTRWSSRWVCWRAHDLGWKPELFHDFERHDVTHTGRMDHKVERIGKKYQWIALHELLARLADHVAFREDPWETGPSRYEGPWQVSARDIDPSLVPAANRAVHTNPECWWAAPRPPLPKLAPADRMSWVDYDGDLLNRPGLVEAIDPSGRAWLVLEGFASYCREERRHGRKRMEQEAWYRVGCLVCRKRDLPRLVRALAGVRLADMDSVPKYGTSWRQFLGEYPWHPSWSSTEDWMALRDQRGGKPISVRRPSLEYLAERGGYDYSFDDTIRMELPAPWLLDGLGGRLANGQRPSYADGNGRTIFFDPSIGAEGPSFALVDRDAFLGLLERDGLAAAWIVAGEKNAYGAGRGRFMDFSFGGSRRHSAIYTFRRGDFTGTVASERAYPSAEQEDEFLRDGAGNS